MIPVPNCSSCAACANVCPRGAIAMTLDEMGFYRPSVDSEKCVECGACELACPWTKNVANPSGASDSPKAFAAYATDETIRLASSGWRSWARRISGISWSMTRRTWKSFAAPNMCRRMPDLSIGKFARFCVPGARCSFRGRRARWRLSTRCSEQNALKT